MFYSLGSWVRRAVSGDFQRNENLINEVGQRRVGWIYILERERGGERERERENSNSETYFARIVVLGSVKILTTSPC